MVVSKDSGLHDSVVSLAGIYCQDEILLRVREEFVKNSYSSAPVL